MTRKCSKGPRRGQTPTSDRHDSEAKSQSVSAESGEQEEYKVGPGRPPREHQFRPGESGNKKGRPRKNALAADLKLALMRALRKKAKITEGDHQSITTWAQAGIQHLVHQYAQGDRHARHDLFWMAERLGLDMRADIPETGEARHEEGKALLDRYVQRQIAERERRAEEPVLAPPELLDDDAGSEI